MNKNVVFECPIKVPGVSEARFTGENLIKLNCPTGFYKNEDPTYLGIVFRDKDGGCTYFDPAGSVYPFEVNPWGNVTFVYCGDIQAIQIKLKN